MKHNMGLALGKKHYYPFGMLMPERHGYKIDGGWASGTDNINGNSIPQQITADSRTDNTPAEYKASQFIEFLTGFSSGNTDNFVAEIATSSNTTATSSLTANVGSENIYRYGFQNQEKDDELLGDGNAISYDYRVHDPRIGRFLSVDPLDEDYPWNSPFAFGSNRVLDRNELEGLETGPQYWMQYTPAAKSARMTSETWTKIHQTNSEEAYTYSSIALGFTPIGWITDGIDFFSALAKGDKGGMMMAGIGLFPGGDLIKLRKLKNLSKANNAKDVVNSSQKTADKLPVWKKSEAYQEAATQGTPQKPFLNKQEVKGKPSGSSVVDIWDPLTLTAYEIKNYHKSLAKGNYSGLVNTIVSQYEKRLKNLPEKAGQIFKIDMTEFKISKDLQDKIENGVMNKISDKSKIQIKFFERK